MSGVMEIAEYFWNLGLNTIPSKDVCYRHIEKNAIKNYINRNAIPGICDYCGRNTKVMSLENLLIFVMGTVSHFYTDAVNFLSYNGEEGGYQGITYDIKQILEEHFRLEVDDFLFEDFYNSLDMNKIWANELDYGDTPAETLIFSWEYFKDIVKYRSRYYFGMVKDLNSVDYRLMPEMILKEIGLYIKNFRLIKKIDINTTIYRCRQHAINDLSVRTQEGMASPPKKYALFPNRMSPAGISMFYGAFEEDTTIVEVVDNNDSDKPCYTTVKFITKNKMNVIDLTALPSIPSRFDERRRKSYYPLIFLHNFANDLAKPVNKDDVHVDYVPTQIITEYFRFPFSEIFKNRIDGIIYKSSKNNKRACVLFYDNDEVSKVLDYNSQSSVSYGIQKTNTVTN
ncbi:RES domain-containing protein [Elizabethkingia anophelis]|nr:RES domain-containing protein [Elizabethkingia anophelis]